MKNSLLKFQELTLLQKKEVFLQSQKILGQAHGDSRFLITRGNVEEQREFYKSFILQYKGFVFYNDDIVVFYNKLMAEDVKDLNVLVKRNLYAAPPDVYNTIAIDFATFRNMKIAKSFYDAVNEENFVYVLFVKNNVPKLYKKSDLADALKYLSTL
jgi:hypothetical protein